MGRAVVGTAPRGLGAARALQSSSTMGKLGLALTLWVLSACASDDLGGDVDGMSGPDAGGGTDTAPGDAWLVEDFALGDGPAWPAGWAPLGGVASAGVTQGRAWLTPTVSAYTLGRMGHALGAGATADVDVAFLFSLADPVRQGVGFYVRQNGGYLTATNPRGGGYAVFVEAFRGPQIGLWRERDGIEESLVRVAVPALDANASYRVRFRCTQDGASTQLAARIWRASAAEPSTWDVTITDATPALQNVVGAIAVDAWNTATPGNGSPPASIFFDDITVAAAR